MFGYILENFSYNIVEKSSDDIYIITAGGTIDKVYDFLSGKMVVGSSIIGDILKSVSYSNFYNIDEVFRKDSLDISDSDRDLILDMVNKSNCNHILITHGTDKIFESADIIAKYSTNIFNKVIIFTGSLLPYSIKSSDACFNVGTALFAFKFLCPGVYVSMHGKVLPYNVYVKDKSIGVFKEIDN